MIALPSFKVPVKRPINFTAAYYFAKANLTDDPYGFQVCVSNVINVDCKNRSYNFLMTEIRDAFADYLPKHGRGNTDRLKVTVFGPYSTKELAEIKFKDEISELQGRFNLKVASTDYFYFSCK
jgi:hypothetical protein